MYFCTVMDYIIFIFGSRYTSTKTGDTHMPKKTVELKLVGLDGNAYSLMGAFQTQARREGWTKDEINEVLNDCMSSDYNHLVATLANVCVDPDEDEDDDNDM